MTYTQFTWIEIRFNSYLPESDQLCHAPHTGHQNETRWVQLNQPKN